MQVQGTGGMAAKGKDGPLLNSRQGMSALEGHGGIGCWDWVWCILQLNQEQGVDGSWVLRDCELLPGSKGVLDVFN